MLFGLFRFFWWACGPCGLLASVGWVGGPGGPPGSGLWLRVHAFPRIHATQVSCRALTAVGALRLAGTATRAWTTAIMVDGTNQVTPGQQQTK